MANTKIETLAGKFIQVFSGNGTWGYLPLVENTQEMLSIANAAIDPYWGKSHLTDNVVDGYGVKISGTGPYWEVYLNEAAAQREIARVNEIIASKGV
jgi:hypothetical protein